MLEAAFYVGSAFWLGALHAATPGHGKTVAAAYLVGNRGRVVDAIVLGIVVTLSHTGGIVLFGILATLGSSALLPRHAEGWLALGTGSLIVGLGAWMLWTQRRCLPWAVAAAPTPAVAPAGGDHGEAHHLHRHDQHPRDSARADPHDHSAGWHNHGSKHLHDPMLGLETIRRPSLGLLLGLGIAGGVMPDPAALAVLLSAIANSRLVLGLMTVVVFSLGFASVLVLVGLVAARVGHIVLDRIGNRSWSGWVQFATSVLVVTVGVVLTFGAWRALTSAM